MRMPNEELHIPLYIQISKIIEEKINEGKIDERIPSERELMDYFSVSRTTVRNAVDQLVSSGWLKKIHGKGTFVTEKSPIQDWLSTLNSFTETVKNMGFKPGSKVIETEVIRKKDNFIDVFEHDVFSIKRLRYADDRPVAIEQHYYNLELGEKLATYDLETATIYQLLEEELKINLVEAEQFISSKMIDEETAHYFEVSKNSSILHVERIIYNENEQPVEYYIGLYRPDMYVFRVKSKRKFS